MKRMIAAILMVAFGVVDAQTYSIHGFSEGQTLVSCGTFVLEDPIPEAKTQWMARMLGFLTGVNSLRERNTLDIDKNGYYASILNYCKNNPLDGVIKAFVELDRKLGPGSKPVFGDPGYDAQIQNKRK